MSDGHKSDDVDSNEPVITCVEPLPNDIKYLNEAIKISQKSKDSRTPVYI